MHQNLSYNPNYYFKTHIVVTQPLYNSHYMHSHVIYGLKKLLVGDASQTTNPRRRQLVVFQTTSSRRRGLVVLDEKASGTTNICIVTRSRRSRGQ